MPNQLSIPFKRTWDIPVRAAVRDYILKKYTDTHPDAFRWDIGHWEILRKNGVGGVVHVDRVNPALCYHAQLVFILTKLPPDIGLEIPYAPAFNASALPITLSNLAYERAAILFNLAALFSQLAASEDRANPQGLKQAIGHYQNAAGTLNFLGSSAIPAIKSSVNGEDMPLEFTETFIGSLEYLMLAQAQECVWQRAVIDNYKNGLIAKLAVKVSSLYASALWRLREAPSSVQYLLPSHWIPHLETKQLHFEAAAQYRKSIDDLEANKYGYEIARLSQAQIVAKKGYDTARRGSVAQAVLNDIKSLWDNVQKSISRAERDNDLIYHQDVPSLSALPPIQEVNMVKSIIHPGLTDPKRAIGDDAAIFGELLGWGARVAIEIYNDRRQNLIKEEVIDRAQQSDDRARKLLESLNLPAALEALERPIGLPPSLLRKAEEVRVEDGPTRIESSIENVRKLAHSDKGILNEAMDVLDQETEDDESFRAQYPVDRAPSHEANEELVAKAERYRGILDQAAESDELVRQKWEEWERNIVELTWDESELEASVPSSAIALTQDPSVAVVTPTQTHARALRVLLESLDDITRSRADLVRRATRIAETEDITPRILKAASAIERWVEVQPSMFEDVLEEELAKYDKFRIGIEEGEREQVVLLESVKQRHASFLQSRRDDPTVKEREHALQSLDLTYHKYKEITRNLDEGLKFYNDFANVLAQFRDACKDWVNSRRDEIHTLVRSLEAVSVEDHDGSPVLQAPGSSPTPQLEHGALPPPSNTPKAALNLPPPDSEEWETVALPPGPPPQSPLPQTKRAR